jgi:Right handed beta helix region
MRKWNVVDVDVINAGNLRLSGIERRGFTYTCGGVAGGTARVCEDVKFDNYHVRGGNYAILIQGYAYTPHSSRAIFAGVSTSSVNCYIDRITVRTVSYNSGAPHPGGATTGYSSCAVMIGGYAGGGSVLIEDCDLRNTADDIIEINGMRDVSIRHCRLENAKYEKLFLTNYGGMPQPDEQHVLIEQCTFVDSSLSCPGISLAGASSMGHVTIRNKLFLNEVSAGGGGIRAITDFASLTIEGNVFEYPASAVRVGAFNSDNIFANVVDITPRGGRQVIRVGRNQLRLKGTFSNGGFSNVVHGVAFINIGAPDADVEILDNSSRIAMTVNGSPPGTYRAMQCGPLSGPLHLGRAAGGTACGIKGSRRPALMSRDAVGDLDHHRRRAREPRFWLALTRPGKSSP